VLHRQFLVSTNNQNHWVYELCPSSINALILSVVLFSCRLTLFLALVIPFTMKKEATRSSETSVCGKSTRPHIPEGVILQTFFCVLLPPM
jgi:hypothetical protein